MCLCCCVVAFDVGLVVVGSGFQVLVCGFRCLWLLL